MHRTILLVVLHVIIAGTVGVVFAVWNNNPIYILLIAVFYALGVLTAIERKRG